MPVTGVINSFLTMFCGLITGENSNLVLEICSKVRDYSGTQDKTHYHYYYHFTKYSCCQIAI